MVHICGGKEGIIIMVDMYVVCLPGVWYVLVWTRTRTSVGITCYLLLSPAQAVTLVTLQGYNQYRQSLVIQSDHILICWNYSNITSEDTCIQYYENKTFRFIFHEIK